MRKKPRVCLSPWECHPLLWLQFQLPWVETAPACLLTSGALLHWPSLTVLILACICILVSVVAAPCLGHALRPSPFPSRQIPPLQPWHSLPPPTPPQQLQPPPSPPPGPPSPPSYMYESGDLSDSAEAADMKRQRTMSGRIQRQLHRLPPPPYETSKIKTTHLENPKTPRIYHEIFFASGDTGPISGRTPPSPRRARHLPEPVVLLGFGSPL